jgi:hypothetical protein
LLASRREVRSIEDVQLVVMPEALVNKVPLDSVGQTAVEVQPTATVVLDTPVTAVLETKSTVHATAVAPSQLLSEQDTVVELAGRVQPKTLVLLENRRPTRRCGP